MQTQPSNEEIPAVIRQQVAALNAEQVSALREATAPNGVLTTLLKSVTARSAEMHLRAIPHIDAAGRETLEASKVGVAAAFLKGEYTGQMMLLDLIRVLNLATLPATPSEEVKPTFGVEEVK